MHILDQFKITIFPEDLGSLVSASGNRGKILEMAEKLLATVQGVWRPRAIIRRLKVAQVTHSGVMLTPFDKGRGGCLQLGIAASFLKNAEQGIVGVYSAGNELEKEAARASLQKRYMDGYLYDLIGLAVLEKTRQQLNRVVEEEARKSGWGVGPFLSPGSVHGWELADQENLCALVPLDRIDVELRRGGVFRPFKTISCLIGIGPKYEAKTVGSTCDICSKSHHCELRRSQSQPIQYD